MMIATQAKQPLHSSNNSVGIVRRASISAVHQAWGPVVLFLAVSVLMSGREVNAATTYTWETTTSGSLWGNPGNWSPTGPANGAGNIADFSALNIGYRRL